MIEYDTGNKEASKRKKGSREGVVLEFPSKLSRIATLLRMVDGV